MVTRPFKEVAEVNIDVTKWSSTEFIIVVVILHKAF